VTQEQKDIEWLRAKMAVMATENELLQLERNQARAERDELRAGGQTPRTKHANGYDLFMAIRKALVSLGFEIKQPSAAHWGTVEAMLDEAIFVESPARADMPIVSDLARRVGGLISALDDGRRKLDWEEVVQVVLDELTRTQCPLTEEDIRKAWHDATAESGPKAVLQMVQVRCASTAATNARVTLFRVLRRLNGAEAVDAIILDEIAKLGEVAK
jgi:hypothetical protein